MHNSFEKLGGNPEMPYSPDLPGRLAHIAHARIRESGKVATINDIDEAIKEAMRDGDPARCYIANKEPELLQAVWNKYTEVSKQFVELSIPSENKPEIVKPERDGWMTKHERKQDDTADSRTEFTR